MRAILPVMSNPRTFLTSRVSRLLGLAAFILASAAVSASAETLMMPKRDARKGVPVVVWGITTQSSAAVCTLDFGDATPIQNCAGAERSYKAYTHTYASQGVFTATLTVGTESATTSVTVFDPALLVGGATGDNNRALGINMAIQDGLRYMWYSHANRTSFDTNAQAHWSGNSSETALVALAFQNHGYNLPNNATAPTGLYEKYVVRRALNHVIANLSTITISNQTAGDPRVAGLGVIAGDSIALTAPYPAGYASAIAMLPFAGSGALNRVSTEVTGYTNGKTFGEILQRISNGLAFGQLDASHGPANRGSWFYNYNNGYHDGSTVGWDILAFLAAEAAGATVPGWVKSEFQITLDCHVKTNGAWDYGHAQTCGGTGDYTTIEKGGIPLQGMAWTGDSTKAPLVINWINTYWNGGPTWSCPANYGCGYAMFNNFKGLKLQGVNTLSNVNRSTRAWKFLGTTGVEDDWYADYQDYLVYTQNNPPTSTTGGNWPSMQLAAGLTGGWGSSIAELILSPVALVLPDADKFGQFGLSPATNTAIEGGSHTVTAKAESTGGTPVPGATVSFTILTGPNAGMTGTDTTDSNGEATFTYTDGGPLGTIGTDTIRAAIGTLSSNIVEAIWIPRNSPPVATDNTYPATEDTQLTGNAVTDAVADSDPDAGDTLTATLLTPVASGALVFNANGSFTYDPAPNFCGGVSFTYQVNDGTVDSNIATVTINVACVNDPPVANDNTHSTLEDTPVSGTATSTDIDGGAPTYAQSSPASNGSVVFHADGTYTYTPNANFNGTDAFGFTVSDGNGGTDTGVVNITIISVNDVPVCTAAAPSVAQIWPPNHKLVNLTIGGVADVEGAITINVTSIFQDEPTNTQGDGNTPIDGYGVGTSTAQVRAERAGTPKLPGNGRMYHISFEGIDSDGAKCTGVVKVGVPHDQGKGSTVIDGGPIYKSTAP